jgi:hypothetical protein
MITSKEFLDLIFDDLNDDEYVCVTRATPKKDGTGSWFKNHLLTDRQWRKWDAFKQPAAWYFCVSTIDGGLNDKQSMVGRGRSNLRRYFCLVLDDIGTKAIEPPVRPSWVLESSTGNYQWGYLLDPGDDWGRYEALVEYCHRKGWGDAGAGGSYRVMRVPGSANTKPGRQLFKSVVHEVDGAVWSLDELAELLGCDFDNIDVKDPNVLSSKVGGATAMDGIDPLLDWLSDNNHVISDTGSSWVDVICPWADAHTSGENKAGYSPLGRGENGWVQFRAFKCLHEHCVDKKLGDFVQWSVGLGSPAVWGFDPLPWLQSKYVYVETGQLVVDLEQRPSGGRWVWDLADWTKKHPGRVRVAGRENPVNVATAFIEDDATRRCVDIIYRPVPRGSDTGIITKGGQDYINTYVPPNHAETTEDPVVFLDHMDYLIPEPRQREIFLNWLAHKVQHPHLRSYGVCMIADGAYGTGRSWLKTMMGKVLGGHVNTASLAQLYGKGTSAEQTYNDWMVCQYVVVEEAKDSGLSKDDFYHGYETFKSNCDTSVATDQRINPKYGRTRYEDIYYNVMIFSNHTDAMCLTEDDRRVYVIDNPTTRLDYDYYDRLQGSLQTQEPQRIYWWLMRRDVSGFDRIYPEMTPGKQRMIEDTRAPSDAIMEWLRDNYVPDLVTKASLKLAIVLAARELDLEKQMREPGSIMKMIWRKASGLRGSDVKNGARYVIDGKQTEIRALRNQNKWSALDDERNQIELIEEINKGSAKNKVVFLRELE